MISTTPCPPPKTSHVSKIIGLWRGNDGSLVEVSYGGVETESPNFRNAIDALKEPRVRLRTMMELNDGSRINLPANETAHILPDAPGVLVLFDDGVFPGDDSLSFPAPGNAAIFNSDGSLRFRLKNPEGKHAHFRAVVALSMPDGSRGVGVRACPKDHSACEYVYAVDGSTDDLSMQAPRWVRD